MQEQPRQAKSFQQQVYDVVAQIPAGSVATYGQIAAILGRPGAARAVGTAVRNTPCDLKIPCHRVVNKAGDMAPGDVFGGEGRQRAVLESEGVGFCPDGRVDFEKSLWGCSGNTPDRTNGS